MGPPPRSFAAEAHGCFMVRIPRGSNRIQGRGARSRAQGGLPSVVPLRLSPLFFECQGDEEPADDLDVGFLPTLTPSGEGAMPLKFVDTGCPIQADTEQVPRAKSRSLVVCKFAADCMHGIGQIGSDLEAQRRRSCLRPLRVREPPPAPSSPLPSLVACHVSRRPELPKPSPGRPAFTRRLSCSTCFENVIAAAASVATARRPLSSARPHTGRPGSFPRYGTWFTVGADHACGRTAWQLQHPACREQESIVWPRCDRPGTGKSAALPLPYSHRPATIRSRLSGTA